jgi:mono/diheme cytochrome c family protein
MPSRIGMISGLATAGLMLGTLASLAEQATPSPLEKQGRALAERMCAQCHAVGRPGKSPHAGAPLFRELAVASTSILSWTACARG